MRLADRHAVLVYLLALIGLLGALACAPAEKAAEESAPADTAAVPTEPRVFFIEPLDGSMVGTLVLARFGAENFTIEPVGDGAIHHGAGHYHIGVDTECLPAGEIIPQAAPWIHFGDGSSEIELSLNPGEIKLCLQVGDGEHRTLEGEGMSQLITVHVEEVEEEQEDDEQPQA